MVEGVSWQGLARVSIYLLDTVSQLKLKEWNEEHFRELKEWKSKLIMEIVGIGKVEQKGSIIADLDKRRTSCERELGRVLLNEDVS